MGRDEQEQREKTDTLENLAISWTTDPDTNTDTDTNHLAAQRSQAMSKWVGLLRVNSIDVRPTERHKGDCSCMDVKQTSTLSRFRSMTQTSHCQADAASAGWSKSFSPEESPYKDWQLPRGRMMHCRKTKIELFTLYVWLLTDMYVSRIQSTKHESNYIHCQ